MPDINVKKFLGCQAPLAPVLTQALLPHFSSEIGYLAPVIWEKSTYVLTHDCLINEKNRINEQGGQDLLI